MSSDAERILAYIEDKKRIVEAVLDLDPDLDSRNLTAKNRATELGALAVAVKALKGLSHFSDRRGHAAAQALATIANTLGATDATKP